MSTGWNATDQVFFHILHALGDRTAISSARLPGAIVPSSRPKSERLRPDPRRTLQQREAGHARGHRPHREQLAEDIQISTLARLSVPTATRTPEA